MASGRILDKRNSLEFFVMERAIRIRWATLFAMSHRTLIDRAVDTTIVSTMGMLIMYRCCVVLMLHACLNWHLVTLCAQTLPYMELITTICGMSTSTSMSN